MPKLRSEIEDELFDTGAAAVARLRLSYAKLFCVESWRLVGREFGLTPRELQIAILIAKGLKYDRIAEQLQIAEATLKNYRKQILIKLRCHTTQRAILKMILATGLLCPEI